MKIVAILPAIALSMQAICFSQQTRNGTFIVNTCTVPDTVGAAYTVQIRGNKPPLSGATTRADK